MNIRFEISDGEFTAQASVKGKSISAKGRVTLEEDQDSIIESYALFLKHLEKFCPGEFTYNRTSSGK